MFEAFEFLAKKLKPHFLRNIKKAEINMELKRLGIRYKPNMNEGTMGAFDDYKAEYKGRPADFNKHLVLGTSRSPERCFRIHFEWDAQADKIAIHYAGKHPRNTKT